MTLLIATLALGLIILPQTVSLFEGQHIWYDPDRLKCQKCHADIADEFLSAENHHPPRGLTMDDVDQACVTCHQVAPDFSPVDPATGTHAAITVECTDCHDVAGTFTNDAHLPFIEAAELNETFPGATEACVACHTHVKTNITWTYKAAFAFDAERDVDGWTVGNFSAEGDVVRVTDP